MWPCGHCQLCKPSLFRKWAGMWLPVAETGLSQRFGECVEVQMSWWSADSESVKIKSRTEESLSVETTFRWGHKKNNLNGGQDKQTGTTIWKKKWDKNSERARDDTLVQDGLRVLWTHSDRNVQSRAVFPEHVFAIQKQYFLHFAKLHSHRPMHNTGSSHEVNWSREPVSYDHFHDTFSLYLWKTTL